MLRVERSDVNRLFEALGYKKAPGWSPDLMQNKIESLPDVVKKEKPALDVSLKKLLSKLVKAVRDDEEIDVVEAEPPPSKKSAAPAGKSKSRRNWKVDDEPEDSDEDDDIGSEDDDDDNDGDDDNDDSDSNDDEDEDDDEDDEDDDEEEDDDEDDEDDDEEDDDDDDDDDEGDDDDNQDGGVCGSESGPDSAKISALFRKWEKELLSIIS